MPKDHFQKPKSSQQQINELAHHIDQLYQIAQDINNRLIALSRAKIDPDVVADFLLDQDKNAAYMKEFGEALDRKLKERINKTADKLIDQPHERPVPGN